MIFADSGSMEDHDYERFMSTNEVKNNGKSIPVKGTAKSANPFQKLQLTPTIWPMPYPVCLFDQYPNQSSYMPLSLPLYSDLVSAQDSEFPFQNPFQDSSPPNHIQVQANMVQFLHGFNYVNNLAQPTGKGISPTGSAMSDAPTFAKLNQQRNAMSQQPVANTPYFCGYILLPTIRSPLIPGTSQSDRSADEAKDSSGESGKLSRKYGVIMQNNLGKRNFVNFL